MRAPTRTRSCASGARAASPRTGRVAGHRGPTGGIEIAFEEALVDLDRLVQAPADGRRASGRQLRGRRRRASRDSRYRRRRSRCPPRAAMLVGVADRQIAAFGQGLRHRRRQVRRWRPWSRSGPASRQRRRSQTPTPRRRDPRRAVRPPRAQCRLRRRLTRPPPRRARPQRRRARHRPLPRRPPPRRRLRPTPDRRQHVPTSTTPTISPVLTGPQTIATPPETTTTGTDATSTTSGTGTKISDRRRSSSQPPRDPLPCRCPGRPRTAKGSLSTPGQAEDRPRHPQGPHAIKNHGAGSRLDRQQHRPFRPARHSHKTGARSAKLRARDRAPPP